MADVLPPPARPPPTPRTNADFRALLDTPRANRGGQTPAKGQQKAQPPKKRPPRPQPKLDTDDADEGPQYRDRAEERRKGLNPDYERNAMSGLPGTDDQLNPTMSVEETKYLGGDLEHTHLVKGLDYALLQKVKTEQTGKQLQDGHESKAKPQKAKQKQEIKFVTPTGQAVYTALFKPFKAPASMMFLPRRTAFVYDLEEQEGNTDVPTTLRRSKEDCPPPVPTISGHVDKAVLERMAKIMSYMRVSSGKPGKKPKKSKDKLAALHGIGHSQGTGFPVVHGTENIIPKAAAKDGSMPLPASAAKADDEDIFGDAGTNYVCELPQSRSQASSEQQGKASSYFGGDKDKMDDLPALPKPDNNAGEDMELDDGEVPPPPPLPLPEGGPSGPAPPPPDYDYAQGYNSYGAHMNGDPATYEAYVASNVQYQASTDPEYQALLSQRQQLQDPDAAAAMGSMTKEQKDAGFASVFKRDDSEQKKRKELDARERESAFVPDAYGECYPGYHELGTAVVDDDEADFTAMDSKEKGQSRYDFDTEEQWTAYKSSKEANPKAAFQFGVKMSEGRKTHKDLGKSRDQKISNQLGKIKNILEKDGGDYGKAFKASSASAEDTSNANNKRRRI